MGPGMRSKYQAATMAGQGSELQALAEQSKMAQGRVQKEGSFINSFCYPWIR